MMFKRLYFAFVVVVLITANVSPAEFQVNTYTHYPQFYPAIDMDAEGNFLIVWLSSVQDGRSGGVFGQRFAADGSPIGDEFKINSALIHSWYSPPSVAMSPDGNFVVVWTRLETDGTPDADIIARLFDAEGVPVTGELLVNTYTDSMQWEPRVAMNDSGAFVVVWEGWRGDHNGQYYTTGRVYNAAGEPQSEELIITQLPFGQNPDVVMDNSGDFVIVWNRRGGTNVPPLGRYVRFRRYNADGTPKGDAVQITDELGIQWSAPSIAMDGTGNFVIAYHDGDFDAGYCDVYAQVFDLNGDRIRGPYMVNSYIEGGFRFWPSVAMKDNGEHVIVWHSQYQDGSGYGVYGQRYDSNGIPIGEEFRLNTYVEADQQHADVVIAESGMFVAAWESDGQDGSYEGIYGELFEINCAVPAAVDIKPGSCPNPLNLAGRGVLPVAVLGTEDFDVSGIDAASICLEGIGAVRSSYEDVAGPVYDGNECDCNSTGPDGYLDLTLKFRTPQLAEKLSFEIDDIAAGDVVPLQLSGSLLDGPDIEGGDCVVIVGKVPEAVAAGRGDINEDGFVDMFDFAILGRYWLEEAELWD